MRGSATAIAKKTVLPSFTILTLNLPAAAATLDMTDLEWRLEDVIVAVENAMWDTAEEAEAGAAAEGPAGPEDDEEGGSNLKGRYRFNGDGALGGGS